MTTGCNGCSDCCKAIGLRKLSPAMEKDLKETNSMPKGWERISKRIAKKLNPHMFRKGSLPNTWRSNSTYFKCNHLKDYGCEIHKESPYVCSGYPYYGNSLEEVKELSKDDAYRYEYSDNCNMREEILSIKTEVEYDRYLLSHFSNFVDTFSDKLHKSRSEFPDRLIPTVNLP